MLVGASLLLFLVLKSAPAEDHTALRLDASIAESAPSAQAQARPSVSWEYLSWLGKASVGDFGVSRTLQKGRQASELIWPSTSKSLSLLFMSLLILVGLGFSLALGRMRHPNSPGWTLAEGVATLFSAIPIFLLVYGAVAGGNRLIDHGAHAGWWSAPEWFPLPFRDDLVPWLAAALFLAVGDGGLMDVMQRFRSELSVSASGEHITGVRAMGLSLPGVVLRGFLPGALSHLSRRISFLLGSMVVLEAALGWPGLGYLAWRAAAERDMPVLLGAALVMAGGLRLAHMASEMAVYAFDPRRRGA